MRSVVQLYPGPPLYRGAVAQLGERLVCNQEATGSIPVSSTKESAEDDLEYAVDRIAGLGGLLVPIVAIIVRWRDCYRHDDPEAPGADR